MISFNVLSTTSSAILDAIESDTSPQMMRSRVRKVLFQLNCFVRERGRMRFHLDREAAILIFDNLQLARGFYSAYCAYFTEA